MISKLTGKISIFDHRSIIIEVGGIGYRVFAGQSLMAKAISEETAEIWTHLATKENSMELFGFENRKELDFFELLISVTGIGPKSALGILNISSVDSLKHGILEGDVTYLTKVSGIGKKTAEKIVLELRDKLGEKGGVGSGTKEDVEVIEALQTLGYSREEAREALKKIPPEVSGTSEKIKQALKNLSR